MKFAFLIFIFLFFIAPCAAQESCAPENAPALFGLKLGMSPAQVQSILGKSLKIKISKSGQSTFFQNFIEKAAPSSLNGVRAVYLRFFDGRLYQIEIFYEQANEPRTLAGFINLQSANLNLPVTNWKIEYGIAEFNCGEFSIVADYVLNPRIQITDPVGLAKVEAIRSEDN